MVTLIGNLIDNAFDASLSAHSDEVRLSMTDMGTDIIIEVEDDGAGIDPNTINTLFNSGVSSKGEGRGIGLFLVQETIESLGGHITVEASQSGGCRFTLYLPRIGKDV
jgi:sensor histidine kinase regulating citrate/malate metabolism